MNDQEIQVFTEQPFNSYLKKMFSSAGQWVAKTYIRPKVRRHFYRHGYRVEKRFRKSGAYSDQTQSEPILESLWHWFGEAIIKTEGLDLSTPCYLRIGGFAAFLLLAMFPLKAQVENSPSLRGRLTSGSETITTNLKAVDDASQSLWERAYLFGDNGRSRLEEKGLKFDFYYIDDALTNPFGGREDAALWGRIRGSADIDFSKFTSWRGLTFHATGLWQYGTDLSGQYTNVLVNSSSLPSAHTLRLDSYFLQQYFLHHKFAIRVGQIAAYDTYGNSEYGASFVNLVMGYAHSNLNQAVVFAFNPAGVPSFEVKALPTRNIYVKGMVQSEERNPYSIDKNGFAFHLGGPVVATEIGIIKDSQQETDTSDPNAASRNHPSIYKFGAGYNPHNFVDLLTQRSSPGNYLIYGQVAQAVFRLGKVGTDRNRGLDLLYGEDWTPGEATQNNHQIMAGGRWNGVFGGRHSADTLGIGYVWTSVGSHYRQAQASAGKGNLTNEHLVEINYLANITPWLFVQPVAQWYVQPGGNASRGIVFVTGFRTKVTF